MPSQFTCNSRVFRQYIGHILQYVNGSRREVGEVSDWGGNQIKGAEGAVCGAQAVANKRRTKERNSTPPFSSSLQSTSPAVSRIKICAASMVSLASSASQSVSKAGTSPSVKSEAKRTRLLMLRLIYRHSSRCSLRRSANEAPAAGRGAGS